MQVISMQAMCQQADLLSGVKTITKPNPESLEHGRAACNIPVNQIGNCAECKALPVESRRNRAFRRGTIPAISNVFVHLLATSSLELSEKGIACCIGLSFFGGGAAGRSAGVFRFGGNSRSDRES